MIDQVKRAIEQIEMLPVDRQLEIAQLILDELKWNETFQRSQNELSTLAREALEEYESGNTSDKDW
ncbi:MAG TPA: hypothetical protein VKZ56_00280 [Membranihabitans sp.]|nr:hypothetical protein [Membranihabitans sp.]